jgi:hypothetical protein
LSIHLSGKGWFAGVLWVGLLSTNIANLLELIKLSGVIWMLLINGTPIFG